MGKDSDLSFIESFALSGLAAVVSKTAAAPIERIKLQVQNQSEMIKAGRLSHPYKGIIDCSVRTYNAEGLLSFWRGNLANCLRYFPTQALNFSFRDQIKAIFKSDKNESYAKKMSKNIASGGVAGSISLTFVYSLDYARTRLANDNKATSKGLAERQFNGLIDVYRKTLKSDGVSGLYRGFVISCVGIFIYRGFYFGLYDTLKPLLPSENSIVINFILGYFVTVVAGLLSYPIDTVRRRMMMTSGEAVKYNGSIDCLIKIIKTDGSMSLMKGAGANILRGIAGAGVLSGFDKLKELYIESRMKFVV